MMCKIKAFQEILSEDDIKSILSESSSNMSEEVDFEMFLRVSEIIVSSTFIPNIICCFERMNNFGL